MSSRNRVSGDLLIRRPPGQQLQHLPLTRREVDVPQGRPGREGLLPSVTELAEDATGQAVVERAVAGGDGADGVEQDRLVRALEQEPGCARLEGGEDVVVDIERREDQHSC